MAYITHSNNASLNIPYLCISFPNQSQETMSDFKSLGLSPDILRGVEDLGFESPTPIQEAIIPKALTTESDIVGLAQTGTGKTAAFGLPILEAIELSDKSIQALVLAPTRELCVQITNDLRDFSKYMEGVRVVSVYGGERIDIQLNALKKNPQIIAATPGRMVDLIKRKAIDLSNINTLVLDEADEMLNMGFKEELDFILNETPKKDKRTFLFSATMAGEVARIASTYLSNPIEITIGNKNEASDNIRHIYYQVHERDRYLALKRIADINPDIYGIVFCRTRMETKAVAAKFMKDGYSADSLHGDLNQNQRDAVMNNFRQRNIQMLVATDVAARGIDVKDITHVINYNLPEETEVYTHRSGRTGRAGSKGVCISIINFKEIYKIRRIENAIKKKIEKTPVPTGAEVCEKQLFSLINRMEHVEVDEKQISAFMPAVNSMLQHLTKEDIIKRFVSLEFNRFLEYYRDAPDINDSRKNAKSEKVWDDKGSDGGGRSRGGERGGRSKGGRNSRIPFQRFFVSLGNKDGIGPSQLIGVINKHLNDRDIIIGEIDMKDSFSFIEVGAKHADTVQKVMSGKKYRDRIIKFEPAEKKSDSNNSNEDGGFFNKKKKKNKANKNKGKRRG